MSVENVKRRRSQVLTNFGVDLAREVNKRSFLYDDSATSPGDRNDAYAQIAYILNEKYKIADTGLHNY